MKNFRLRSSLFLLFLLSSCFAFSQAKQITGKIIDEANQPILGATIFVEGTSVGTASDIDGNYELNVPSDATILKFSFLGYKTMDITIGNQTIINVTLMEDATQLDQIVVTGFRGAEQRAIAVKRATTSIIEAITTDEGIIVQNQQAATEKYQYYNMGIIEFKTAGKHTITISLVEGDPKTSSLKAVLIKPIK